MSTASLLALPRIQVFDNNGNPLSGAKLYSYAVGTTTPQNTYSDAALLTPNANPLVADSTGLFGAIYLGTAAYKFILKNSANVTQWTQDNIADFRSELIAAGLTWDVVNQRLGVSLAPVSQLANYNVAVSDAAGGGAYIAGAITWSASGQGYIGIIENRDPTATLRSGVLIKTAATDTGSFIAKFESGGINRWTLRSDGVLLGNAAGIIDSTGKIPALSSATLTDLSGANLTTLNATQLTSGTLPTARLADPLQYNTSQVMSFTTKSAETIYQALSDGLLIVQVLFDATASKTDILSDSATPPTTQRASLSVTNIWDTKLLSMMSPIKKGDYYKVRTITGTITSATIYWVPLGTAG